ncbi:MAG TPA: hypothetical protein VGN63_03055 [Flavisolibacter sp.]|nr:hypothetical protein [Flavisolibacter sp.]
MELETIIKFRSSAACYRIQNDSEGIFTANLIYFEGDDEQAPPAGITMVKGIRNWTGSVEDEILLSELGKFIDANWPVNGRKLVF